MILKKDKYIVPLGGVPDRAAMAVGIGNDIGILD